MAWEVKAVVEESVANGIVTIVKEVQDDVLCKRLHTSQSDVWYIIYNFFEQETLYVLYKNVLWQMLDANIAKFFDTEEATEGLSKKLFH